MKTKGKARKKTAGKLQKAARVLKFIAGAAASAAAVKRYTAPRVRMQYFQDTGELVLLGTDGTAREVFAGKAEKNSGNA